MVSKEIGTEVTPMELVTLTIGDTQTPLEVAVLDVSPIIDTVSFQCIFFCPLFFVSSLSLFYMTSYIIAGDLDGESILETFDTSGSVFVNNGEDCSGNLSISGTVTGNIGRIS